MTDSAKTTKKAHSWTGVLKFHGYDNDMTLKEEGIESSLTVLLSEWVDKAVRLTIQDVGLPTDVKPVVVWIKDLPSTAKIIWVPRDATPMTIKDQACKDDTFKWADYEKLKARTLK